MKTVLENLLEIIKSDAFLIGIAIFCFIIFLLYIITIIKLSKIKKEYNNFMKKIGQGDNIIDILDKHIEKINKTVTKNEELEKFCLRLDSDIKNCVQKIGIYRYNAYKDTASDLSFTLALLDEKNDGVVLNGIYSREMSNIYAKKITNGNSANNLTEEEKEALKRAMNK